MAAATTRLAREAAESPAVVRAQLGANDAVIRDLAQRLRRSPPKLVVTLGRGSSDHAATFARYLIETRLGVTTASTPPSVSSVYEALERHGYQPVRALQRLRAVLFAEEQAQLLNVNQGAPGLLIERRGFLRDGRAVEFTQSYYRGDAYDFVAELNDGAP